MSRQLTGPQLFLRYAWPCAEDLLKIRKITPDDFSSLERFVNEKLAPPREFLKRCFPNAVEALENFSELSGNPERWEMWSYETVAEYWRHNHRHEGDCAVCEAVVISIYDRCVYVISGSKAFNAIN